MSRATAAETSRTPYSGEIDVILMGQAKITSGSWFRPPLPLLSVAGGSAIITSSITRGCAGGNDFVLRFFDGGGALAPRFVDVNTPAPPMAAFPIVKLGNLHERTCIASRNAGDAVKYCQCCQMLSMPPIAVNSLYMP